MTNSIPNGDIQPPRISVITSTYNAGKELPRLIESLSLQSFLDFEWVVADGNSTDNTLEVARSFRGRLVCGSRKDSGIYDAWNNALEMAQGEWLIFLGADDRFTDSESLLRINNALSQHPQSAVVVFPVTLEYPASGTQLIVNRSSELGNGAGMHKVMSICHQGVAQKKADIVRFGGFDASLRICGDYDILLASQQHAPFAHEDIAPAISMRIGGISSTLKGAILAYQEMYRIQLRRIGKANWVLPLRRLALITLTTVLPVSTIRRLEHWRMTRMAGN